jgi:hypothetical protein
MNLPNYIIDRLRRPLPPASCIVPGSTPVVAFGNARTATVATLGLNPSRVEFLDRAGHELPEQHRRLETLRSLGVDSLTDAPDSIVARVVAGCDGYFQRNPYWKWFRPLEGILTALGASYATGTACHLDLVQWATDPTWARLPDAVRQRLIAEDAAFLRWQLSEEHITTLLLNGSGVMRSFIQAYQVSLHEVKVITDRSVRCRLLAGVGPRGITVVGWSTNLQSSFGVTRELRRILAAAVAETVASMR